ncbi:MAG: cytochrome c3 family protein [Bacillota bacterium]
MRTKWLLWTGIALFAVALLAGCRPAEKAAEPPPTPTPAPKVELVYSYVGSESCNSCHGQHYQGWLKTAHPYMIQPARAMLPEAKQALQNVLAAGNQAFLNVGLTDRFIESLDEIEYVVGYKWKQRFVVRADDGFRFLTAQYNVPSGTMTRYTESRVYEDRCLGCHTTGFNLDYTKALDRSTSKYSLESLAVELGIGCEGCHGPGNVHAAKPTKDNIVNPSRLTVQQQIDFCGSCHARNSGSTKVAGREDAITYQFGDNLRDHVRVISLANNENVWVRIKDGTIQGYVNAADKGTIVAHPDGASLQHRMQYNDIEQGPHAKVPCTACHNMHGVNSEGQALKGSFAQVCASCHGSKAFDINEIMPYRMRSSDVFDLRSHTFLAGGKGNPNPNIPKSDDSDK